MSNQNQKTSVKPQGKKGQGKNSPKDSSTTPVDVIVTEIPDPVKEAQEIIQNRQVKVFWHKECLNDKKSTLTTLKAEETLRKTDAKVSVPDPKDPSKSLTLDVYSLKRNKRIYYLYDVTPQDIVRAEQEAINKANAKAAEAQKGSLETSTK